MLKNNFLSTLKNHLFESNIYKKICIRHQMDDFKEKLIAISNFQKYIEDQTSFELERRIYTDANNEHIDQLKSDIVDYLNSFKL